MKKYLINGALALIVGFTYTSCKNNDVDYVPIAQQKTQAYAEAFKEMIRFACRNPRGRARGGKKRCMEKFP